MAALCNTPKNSALIDSKAANILSGNSYNTLKIFNNGTLPQPLLGKAVPAFSGEQGLSVAC